MSYQTKYMFKSHLMKCFIDKITANSQRCRNSLVNFWMIFFKSKDLVIILCASICFQAKRAFREVLASEKDSATEMQTRRTIHDAFEMLAIWYLRRGIWLALAILEFGQSGVWFCLNDWENEVSAWVSIMLAWKHNLLKNFLPSTPWYTLGYLNIQICGWPMWISKWQIWNCQFSIHYLCHFLFLVLHGFEFGFPGLNYF